MNQCIVRPAVVSDAESAVAVLRDSITYLCVADHQNDPSTLQRWLQNKTTDNFSQWLQDSERHFVVAELNSEVCGVGMVRNSGDLDLCYIQPGKERLGIGAAMFLRESNLFLGTALCETTTMKKPSAQSRSNKLLNARPRVRHAAH